jgi:hypothetical protein
MTNLTTRYTYDIFLSHSKTDEGWVRDVVERLENEKFNGRRLKVFFSPRDIRPGETIVEAINRGISRSRYVGIVMSPQSLLSPYVEYELNLTVNMILRRQRKKGTLIPILLRECKRVPLELRDINRINFTNASNFEVSYRKLVAVIKGEPLDLVVGRPPASPCAHLDLSKFIPEQPVVFIRRYNKKEEDVLELVKKELAPAKRRPVALWGPGGMGKTTLAVMVARQMYYDFNECIVWINAYEDPQFNLSKMLDLIVTRLGRDNLRAYRLEQKKAKVSELVKSIAPLIILDNFERLKTKEQKECGKWLKDDAACPVLLTTIKRVETALNIPIGKISRDDFHTFLDFLKREGDDDKRGS